MAKKTGAEEYNFPFFLEYCGGILVECQKNRGLKESQAVKEDQILLLVCRLLYEVFKSSSRDNWQQAEGEERSKFKIKHISIIKNHIWGHLAVTKPIGIILNYLRITNMY